MKKFLNVKRTPYKGLGTDSANPMRCGGGGPGGTCGGGCSCGNGNHRPNRKH